MAEHSGTTYRFSQSFHEKLCASIPKEITPDIFIKSFETYITTTPGERHRDGKHTIWIFEISDDIKQSEAFSKCLRALVQSIESTGFTAEPYYSENSGKLNYGKYAILRQMPHICNSNCQREGCYFIMNSTSCDDIYATAVAICM
jgi:hypothetical protein